MSESEIRFDGLVPADEFVGEDDEDTRLVRDMVEGARTYLGSHKWCEEVVETYVSEIAVGGVIVVLLCRIEPAEPDVDEWLWVVYGDVPPAYLVTDGSPNAACALDAYVELMTEWVEAVRAGKPVDELIPVQTQSGGTELEPTEELADELGSRLDFLRREILEDYADELADCPEDFDDEATSPQDALDH